MRGLHPRLYSFAPSGLCCPQPLTPSSPPRGDAPQGQGGVFRASPLPLPIRRTEYSPRRIAPPLSEGGAIHRNLAGKRVISKNLQDGPNTSHYGRDFCRDEDRLAPFTGATTTRKPMSSAG